MWLGKCIKHFYCKCVKIDAICENLILTLFVNICFLFTMRIKCIPKKTADIRRYIRNIVEAICTT